MTIYYDSFREPEYSLISSLIQNPKTIVKVKGIVMIGFFYDTACKLIYKALIELDQQRIPIDLVSLKDFLHRRGELERVVGIEKLMEIYAFAHSHTNYMYYVGLVKENCAKRILAEAGMKDKESAQRALGEAEAILREPPNLEVLLEQAMEEITQTQNEPDMKTGINSIDFVTGGLRRKDISIIGAHTSNGKSAFALSAMKWCITRGKKVHYYTYDLPATAVMKRLILLEGEHYTTNDIYQLRHIPPEQRAERISGLYDAGKRLIDKHLENMRIGEFARIDKIEQGLAEGCDLLIIDYAQVAFEFMMGFGLERRGSQAWATFFNRLKELTNRYNIHTMLLSQFSRPFEQKGDVPRRPAMTDMKESSYFEQAANEVILLDWCWKRGIYGETEDKILQNHINIKIAKNSHLGTSQWYPLKWEPEYQRLRDMTQLEEDELNDRKKEI